jgi:hypothetical protein
VILSIERDWQTSSDHVTLCRVRARNFGARSWSGRSIGFEARALSGGAVVARERGRFGLILEPYGTLETLISFEGRFDRFEVVPAGEKSSSSRGGSRGGKPRARNKSPKSRD